jgi:hypothetical protein
MRKTWSALLVGVVAVVATVAGTVTPAEAATAPADVGRIKIAATRLGDGHAVYVRGRGGQVWWRTVEKFADPAYSTTWRAVPGVVASGPDVVQVEESALWMAARSTSSHLVVRSQYRATFGAWTDLGGELSSAPVLMYQTGADRLWAFARWSDGSIRYRVRGSAGTWAAWKSIGGTFTSAPDAVDGYAGVSVYARDTAGKSRQRTLDPDTGVWGPWSGGGLPTTAATSTVRSDEFFQLQYLRGANHHIYSTVDDGPWDTGFEATSAPDASYGGEVVAARGKDKAVWANYGSGWKSLGGLAD